MKRTNLKFLACFLFLAVLLALPALMEACPRCVDATPYKRGMQWAVAFLLPVPFVVAGFLFHVIRKASEGEAPKS